MDVCVIDEENWPTLLERWPVDTEIIRSLYRAPDASVLVAMEDGRPQGYGVLQWAGGFGPNMRGAFPDAVELNFLWIFENARNRGAGTAIIRAGERLVSRAGRTRMVLGVGDDNADARRLYERLGYTATGVWDTTTYKHRDETGALVEATETDETLIKVVG